MGKSRYIIGKLLQIVSKRLIQITLEIAADVGWSHLLCLFLSQNKKNKFISGLHAVYVHNGLPERDYVTFGSLLSQIRLFVCRL